MLVHEVRDADGAHPDVGEQPLQRSVGADRRVELARQSLVQDQQVDLLDAELAGALVEGVQRLVVAVVADPDLRLDEDLVAGETEAADRLADLALVAVGGGGSGWPRVCALSRAASPRSARVPGPAAAAVAR